eukprot:Skav230175  [mRNA]  locus=scaffold196:63757:70500:- [translate_table: standard]
MSYFVGADAVTGGIPEDHGFAINGGKGWSDVLRRLCGNPAGELYGYGHGNVLFKPTKAADVQFRPEAGQAMSYFVGADAVTGGIPEDHGFAINGGKGWSDVLFDNHKIDLNGDVAIAMGNYFFTSAEDGSVSKVEYAFGYRKCEDGKVRICLHHSSIPYQGGLPGSGIAVMATAAVGLLARTKRSKCSKIASRAQPPGSNPMSVSMDEVRAAQRAWAETIKKISKIYLEGGDYVAEATKAAGELYGYGHGNVLFKPTKAKDVQFRPEAAQALSYFVGADAIPGGIPEDHGFAINGGKGWSDVLFDNHQIDFQGNVAIAMGNYYFSSAGDGSINKVEYTFGYKKCEDGKVRICLHHSSIPYHGAASVSEEEVKAAQRAWADAIGDYVAVAAEAAGELYGYGHGNVLFKPTKAADVQFRPEAGQAMSYFVGADAVTGGIPEDHGFAINGGKGWSDVLFDNHKIDLNGDVAIAMGNYFFTSAEDGSVSKVEYTFGYRKCEDGKVRICLHHSSIPYQGGATSGQSAVKSSTVATPVAAAFVGSTATCHLSWAGETVGKRLKKSSLWAL